MPDVDQVQLSEQRTDVHFSFLKLPFELQESIIGIALEDEEISKLSILCSCSLLNRIATSIIYANVQLSSIQQVLKFLEKSSGSYINSPIHTRRYTFTLIGVPGGKTLGGRESAPNSPRLGLKRDLQAQKNGNDRLYLASKAAILFPLLEHCTFEMFGVRHSSLLTSSDYLDEEANTFRLALANAKRLKTFSWITPRVNHNFVGVSVAVVDLAITPMIEGLLACATDMEESGRRKWYEKGSLERFIHPLKQIVLHHCIFPMNVYQNESFFNLFAQFHPDDQDWFLFPCLENIIIRTANNIDPKAVAYLALIWQLRLDKFMLKNLSDGVRRFQLNHSQSAQDPKIILSDTFVNSIWGPRVTKELVKAQIKSLVMSSLQPCPEISEGSTSNNPLIRALEESADSTPKLDELWKARLKELQDWEREEIVERACERVIISTVTDAIAGVQSQKI